MWYEPLENYEMKHDEFDKMMGYAMNDVTKLVEKAKEIKRNSIVALNQRDLADNGIESDYWMVLIYTTNKCLSI